MKPSKMYLNLLSGQSLFHTPKGHPVRVDIQISNNFRYRAFITTPKYNTMIETPDTVDREWLGDFCSRLENDLNALMHDFDRTC